MRIEFRFFLFLALLSGPLMFFISPASIEPTPKYKAPQNLKPSGSIAEKDDSKLEPTEPNFHNLKELRAAGRTLFEPAPKEVQAVATQITPSVQSRQLEPAPILIGTFSTNNEWFAFVQTSRPQQEFRLLTVGERVGNFELVDIAIEQIKIKNIETGAVSSLTMPKE